MIVNGPLKVIIGPGGRHRIPHESAAGFASRSRDFVCAHACTSDGFKSKSNLGPACQSPERSGLPSAVRGAAAERFGLPSAVRGIPAVGCVSHCPVLSAGRSSNGTRAAAPVNACVTRMVEPQERLQCNSIPSSPPARHRPPGRPGSVAPQDISRRSASGRPRAARRLQFEIATSHIAGRDQTRIRTPITSGEISRADEELLDRLRKIGAVIDELPVWPFDATTLRRFLTAYVVPALGAASVPLLKWLFPVVFPQLNAWLT